MDFTGYLQLVNNCDPNDPLPSETELGRQLTRIPLEAVEAKLDKTNQALDVEQLIKTDQGLARDYRGLGELMEFSSNEIETRFKRSYKPTESLIGAYINKNLNLNRVITVNDLLKMLEKLERYDIIDDLLPTLIDIVQLSLDSRQSTNRIQNGNILNETQDISNNRLILKDFSEQLTIDDVSSHRIMYDAFICFAPEDFDYAQELISLLEKHGKRIATAYDLLAGHYEHDALVKLIDTRCRKVLTILTPNFLRSKGCEFQTKFASEIAIKSSGPTPKIIPVLFEQCDDTQLPYMIRVISKIDMTNRVAHRWQIRKLLSSLDHQNEESSHHASCYIDRTSYSPNQNRRGIMDYQHPAIESSHRFEYREPIIDLATSANNSCNLSIITKQETSFSPSENGDRATGTVASSPSTSMGPLAWYRHVKRRVFSRQATPNGQKLVGPPSPSLSLSSASSISPSNSSQAILLTPNSTEEFFPSNNNLDKG